jgi:hypothetical protein
MNDIVSHAAANLAALQSNPYPGRGFVVGTEADGNHVVQVYWLMGRSPTSRNRRLVSDGMTVSIEAVDQSQPIDPLTRYDPMRERLFNFVVSNGDQTDTIINGSGPDCFDVATYVRSYEPDAPNYTPRISAMSSVFRSGVRTQMSIISRSPFGHCERALYYYDDPLPGYGHCLHTYSGDGSPLPAFTGKPFLLPLRGSLEEIAEGYWAVLNPKHRVALVAKAIDIDSAQSKVHIVNRY